MIDRNHELPVKRQAELVGISRGSVYYLPKPVSEADLSADARDRRAAPGAPVRGRAHAARHAQGTRLRGRAQARGHADARMGIEALYRKPNTSKRHPQHLIYPYLLRGLAIERANQVVGDGHHVHPDGARLRVPGRDHRLAQPQGAGLGRVDLDGGGLLRARARAGARALRQARDLQHRPGQPVHQPGVHRAAEDRRASPSAWTVAAAGATTCSSSACGAA